MNMYKCKNKDISKRIQNVLRPLFYAPSWANLYIFARHTSVDPISAVIKY